MENTNESSFKNFSKSLFLHAFIFFLAWAKSLYFPEPRHVVLPTLRVDIIGLPDQLKNQMPESAAKPIQSDNNKTSQALEQIKEQAKKIQPKTAPLPSVEEDAIHLKRDESKRKQRLQGALARIKALEKIQDSSESKPNAQLIRGNKVSPGSALSGDAKESLEATYYDTLRSRILENWTLPIWLSRQNLSAEVRVQIDSRGNLRDISFVKSSGNPQFDEAVQSAIKSTHPFPPPPSAISNQLLQPGILMGFPL